METAKHQYTLEPLSLKMVRYEGDKRITAEEDQAEELAHRKAQNIARDQNIAASNSEHGLTRREYAAIHLRLPDSGNEWLDAMITGAWKHTHVELGQRGHAVPATPPQPATPAPSPAELYVGLKAIVNAFAAKEDEPPRPLGTEAEAEAVKAAQILVRWYEKHAPTS